MREGVSVPEPDADEVVREPSRWIPWVLLASVVLSLGMAAFQLARGRAPWTLALVVVAGLLLLLRRPVVLANADGIRLHGRRFTPWSEVEAIRPPADNGWRHQLPEIVTKDGNRSGLESLTSDQIAHLQRLLAASRARE